MDKALLEVGKIIGVRDFLKETAENEIKMRPVWEEFAQAFSSGTLFKAQSFAWAQWLFAAPEDIQADRETMREVWAAAYQAGATVAGPEGETFRSLESFYKHRCDDTYFHPKGKRSVLKQANSLKQNEAQNFWNYHNNKQGWEWYTTLPFSN